MPVRARGFCRAAPGRASATGERFLGRFELTPAGYRGPELPRRARDLATGAAVVIRASGAPGLVMRCGAMVVARDDVPLDTHCMGEVDVDFRVRALVASDVRRAVALMQQEFGGALDRYVRHRRSARAKLGVEDICQEVWRSVQRGLPQPHFEAPIRAWLFGIAARRLIDVARQGPVDDRIDTDRAAAIADSLTGPLSRLLRDERAAAVRAAIARRDPDDAELLHLRFTLDLKPTEISYVRAAETGRPPEPPNTIAQRIARLLVKLGKELAKDELFRSRSGTP